MASSNASNARGKEEELLLPFLVIKKKKSGYLLVQERFCFV